MRATPQRLRAFRHFAEQSAGYWTDLHLEQSHWEYLYEQVSVDQKLGRLASQSHSSRSKVAGFLESIRADFCDKQQLSEENVPLAALAKFYGRHEQHAQLALHFPD